MPLKKEDTNNLIRERIVPNKGQKESCYYVIAQLDFADLGRGSGTLHSIDGVRLDMQGRTGAGEANLQIQIGDHTVAAALIAASLLETKNKENQNGVKNGVISVLNQSMDTGTIWKLSGSLP